MQATAERIKGQMTRLNISVNALAESTAIPRMTLTRRLNSPDTLTLAEVERIAAALDTTPVYLVTGRRVKVA